MSMICIKLVRTNKVLEGEKLEILKHCQRRKQFTDVTIVCDRNFFHVHKLVLASVSKAAREDYLAGGGAQSTLILTGVSSNDVENTITLMYTGEVWVPLAELPGLFKTARMLGIDQFEPNEDVEISDEMLFKPMPKRSHPFHTYNRPWSSSRLSSRQHSRTTPAVSARDQENLHSTTRSASATRTLSDSSLGPPSPILPSGASSESSSRFFASMSSINNSSCDPERLRLLDEEPLELLHGREGSDGSLNAKPGGLDNVPPESIVFPNYQHNISQASTVSDYEPCEDAINSHTSIWAEPEEYSSSSCALNYAMCNLTMPSITSSYSPTAEEIVEHVENLPTDIDTPTSQIGNATYVDVDARMSEDEKHSSRPPTPVLTRTLQYQCTTGVSGSSMIGARDAQGINASSVLNSAIEEERSPPPYKRTRRKAN